MVTSIKFGTDGWRDRMDKDFTLENVALVTQGVANYLKKMKSGKIKIAVGYDTRKNSKQFAEEVCQVLIGNEITCYLTDSDVPTPVITYSIIYYKLDGAIMLTASHNPPEYQGIKFIPEYAGPAMPDVTDEITEEVHQILGTNIINKNENLDFSEKNILLEIFSPKEIYMSHVLKLLNLKKLKEKKIKVAFDPIYGTSREYIPEVLKKLKSEVIILNNKLDPDFGGKDPNPNEKNLTELSNIVKKKHLSIGLACDGDGDRSAAINEKGEFMDANQIFSMLLKYFLDIGKKGGVVRTVSTTHLIDRIAETYNCPLYEVAVGSKYIGEYMRTKDILIGGEESGGLMFKEHIPEKDGIYTNLKILEMILYYNIPLSEIYEKIIKEFGVLHTKLLNFECDEDLKIKVMSRIKKTPPNEILGQKVVKKIDIDGLKFVLDDGSWLLIRPSGTEPLLRCSAEASTKEELENILSEGVKLLEKAKKGSKNS